MMAKKTFKLAGKQKTVTRSFQAYLAAMDFSEKVANIAATAEENPYDTLTMVRSERASIEASIERAAEIMEMDVSEFNQLDPFDVAQVVGEMQRFLLNSEEDNESGEA